MHDEECELCTVLVDSLMCTYPLWAAATKMKLLVAVASTSGNILHLQAAQHQKQVGHSSASLMRASVHVHVSICYSSDLFMSSGDYPPQPEPQLQPEPHPQLPPQHDIFFFFFSNAGRRNQARKQRRSTDACFLLLLVMRN
ncbi:hypothetical protein ABZP36_013935 [Zizania latifolia]